MTEIYNISDGVMYESLLIKMKYSIFKKHWMGAHESDIDGALLSSNKHKNTFFKGIVAELTNGCFMQAVSVLVRTCTKYTFIRIAIILITIMNVIFAV